MGRAPSAGHQDLDPAARGLLAVRILAASDPELQEKMLAFQGELREKAVAKGEALRRKTSHAVGFGA